MRRFFAIVFFLLFVSSVSFATHMRAGEITYVWKGGLTYEITILTYTYTPSLADRPEYEISWGDGTTSIIPRIQKINLPNDISKNNYVGEHTYPGPDTYIISLEDPNRNGGVKNIPNSINVPFYVQTTLIINPFLGPNNSPTLLNPPIDNGCVNVPFIHNPGAYDVDGDSISYSLIPCKGADGLDIPGYTYPQTSSSFSIDAITGDLLWDSPMVLGEYNVAILIQEWRMGTLIGSVTRDMQIEIAECDNHPPIIDELNDTCVLAGSFLAINVMAVDTDHFDVITLNATGGPFMVPISPATFVPATHIDTVSSVFSWQTTCDHVQKQPYHVTFKATDNGNPVKLIDIESWMITVVAPAPPNLVAAPVGNNIHLTWDISPCPNATGYKVYRRNGFYGYIHGHCETGVPAYTGYVEIATVNGVSNTSYTDTNEGNGLIHGIDYCYMVIAIFDDGAESYASNEACTTLIKDVPIITNASVNHTDAVNGSIYVAWSKATALDTTQATGPYKYLIYHSNDLAGTNLVLIDSLDGMNDTTYTDTLINTIGNAWSYRIDLWNNTPGDRYLIGTTQKASSIFLTLTPSDNQLLLDFAPMVPWVNDTFVIYRLNTITSVYDSIGYSTTTQYADTGLVNGRNYCYKVKSIGHYFSPGLIDPLINYSQEVCGVPIDQTPPCSPNLFVLPDCDNVENSLVWTDPNNSCATDVIYYNVYYSATDNGGFELLTTLNNPLDTFYLHQNLSTIVGCYAVTAVDSFQNESAMSNIVCLDIDNCNLYQLPNVFTPDGDQHNDLFIPFPYNFVEKIDLQVFNRWGKVVFTTQDPAINWDGKDKYTNADCSDGVYFYICDVYEIRLSGLMKRTLTGVIHLYR
jgi:gliding motility-associated-like protein